MDIRLSKESEVPIRQQLAEQIVFLIATEQLKPGEVLPSVRGLARRTWLVRRRGSRVIVRAREDFGAPVTGRDLDDLINATIRLAREQGHSLQALRQRVRERLLAQPPDHVLVVEEEAGLCRLLKEEIRTAVGCPVEGCSRAELAVNPGLAIGALATAAQYALADVDPLVPKGRPFLLRLLRRISTCNPSANSSSLRSSRWSQ